MLRLRPASAQLLLALLILNGVACTADPVGSPRPFEGVAYDEEHPNAVLGGGKADGYPITYQVPTNLPTLAAPEVILSLDQLTLHLFDRATGFSAVYPIGVGIKNSHGESITPTGHFESGDDPGDGWWYVPRRWVPAYYGGLPFLRLTTLNSKGYATYGIHGPITATLVRGYVSHGCIRMEKDDIVELFYLVRDHASTPITIQKEVERDASGAEIDVGSTVALWELGETIAYGQSVGPAPWPPPAAPDAGPDATAADTITTDAGIPDGVAPNTGAPSPDAGESDLSLPDTAPLRDAGHGIPDRF